MEFILLILSSGIGAGLMTILLAVIQRRWQKSDKHENDAKREDERIKALVTAQKVLMVDRVRHLGQSYIANKQITLEDKETLQEMHAAYKALGGNGHLATVMAEVERLPVVNRKDG